MGDSKDASIVELQSPGVFHFQVCTPLEKIPDICIIATDFIPLSLAPKILVLPVPYE